MIELDDEKEKAFAAIKDSIPPEYDDPSEDQQKAIDALHKQSGFNPDPVPLVEAASEAIMNMYTFLTVEETGEIWYYNNGVYTRGGEIVIAKESEQMCGYDMTKAKLSEIIAHIMRRTYHKHEELDADINVVNVKNGLYNIDLDCLLPHSPKYLSVNQKPITYVKDAKPKRFWRYL